MCFVIDIRVFSKRVKFKSKFSGIHPQKHKKSPPKRTYFIGRRVGVDFVSLRRTGAHRLRRPPYFRLAFACSRTASRRFFVTPNHKIKNRAFAHFLFCGGCGRTRTADPYDVNVVL